MRTLADYPNLCEQIHPTKNGDFNPVNYTYGSGKKVWWKCPEGDDHEWVTRIDDRTRGRGCPFCSGRRVSVTNNLLVSDPKIANEWHPTKNGDLRPEDVTPNMTRKVWWKCAEGDDHEWSTPINLRTQRKFGCPFCAGQKVSKTNNLLVEYPEIAKEWHPTKNGDLKPENSTFGSGKKVWWKCPHGDDHEWKTAINNRTANKRKCPFCANQKISKNNTLLINHPVIAKEWHPTKNGNLRPDKVVSESNKRVWWKCPKGDDHEWMTSVILRVRQKTGCPFCAGQKVSKTNNFLYKYPEIAKDWHPTKNGDLRPEQFTEGSSKLFWWKCPKVNDHEWKASINGRRFTGCPKCADFRFDHNLPALLYYIAINLDDGKILYKVGITNHSVEQRFPVRDRAKIRIVKLWRFEKGTEAEKFESDILGEFNEFKYTGPKIFRKGNTEIFTKDVLALDDGREVDLTADLPIFRRRQESFDF